MKKEIETPEDIKLLVDNFYTKVRKDSLLENIFNSVIQDNWPEHLEKMYGFWQTVLFHEISYRKSASTSFEPTCSRRTF